MRLSPWGRFFFLWHRRMITEHCRAMAALPTAEGFTASSESLRMLKDVRAYGTTQLQRVVKKVSQRMFGRARFHMVGALVADAPGFTDRLRASPHFRAACDRLAALGVLAPGPAAETVRDAHVGRVLTAGMFLGEFEGLA
jgi:hypothetical protein